MSHPAKRCLFIIVRTLALACGLCWVGCDRVPKTVEADAGAGVSGSAGLLSPLADPPDWSRLDAYQEKVTRDDFIRLLVQVFTTGDDWGRWLKVGEDRVWIGTGGSGGYELKFAADGGVDGGDRYWRRADELPEAPVGRPLEGLRVAIDPGHLGGEWAVMEERHLVVGDQPPVCEGDMTLLVARLVEERLESLGAEVWLVREDSTPLTRLRPADLVGLAEELLKARMVAVGDSSGVLDPDRVRRQAEQLFYRTAEIRARGDAVNQEIRPDVVLCLHFNAESWGDPAAGSLCAHTHCHVLVHGAYSDAELEYEDQRFWMVRKLVSGVHAEEAPLAAEVASVFSEVTGMPPFIYPQGADNVRPADDKGFVWARNLLANRIYDCPVVFLEPYLMNSAIDHPRMVEGDYIGLREVAGKLQPSIFREYAESVVAGLVRHVNARRQAGGAVPTPPAE